MIKADKMNDLTLTEMGEYSQFVETMSSKNPPDMVAWAIAGLDAETGEVSAVLEKAWRKRGFLDESDMVKLKDELGDVIFFWMAACNACGFDPDEVIMENIDKLNKRVSNGTLISR